VQNLSYGTQLDNIHDKWRDQTMTNGERHPLSKLTEETVRQIRQDAGSVSVSEQARRYGVSRPTIRAVIARRTWAHVEA
jgi:DNA-binding transcriptional regulator YiaG